MGGANVEEGLSADLLDHPAFKTLLADAAREAKAARGIILYGPDAASSEEYVTKAERARGSLAVLKNIVLGVYRRANKEVPPQIAAMFE